MEAHERAGHRGPAWGILAGALLLLLAVGWYSLRSKGSDLGQVANLGAPGHVVVFFGDSITQGYRAVAKRYGAVLVEDVMKGILRSPDLKLGAIHPNAQGHRVIAERVVRVLRPLLREADRRRGAAVRQSVDFPLPGLRAVATLHAK